MSQEHKLAAESLTLGESIIMGIAGMAPAFSLAAATATLVSAVGILAPASLFYCGLMMFGIIFAFIYLNKISVNAGASYAWVTQIFGPTLGFFAGWTLLVATALFMVSGCIPAATATLFLLAPSLAENTNWVTLVGALWLSGISAIVLKGIKQASILQVIMTVIEVLILIIITLAALFHFWKHPVHAFSLSWFSPSQFTPSLFATGALTAVFLYWGWDVTLNLNEETKNAAHIPGLGAFWSLPIVIALLVLFSIGALFALSDAQIEKAGTNLLFSVANEIFPRPFSYLAILSVVLSSAGTIETSILQFTRTMFAKGRDKIFHPRFAKLHPAWASPYIAIFFIWAFGIFFLFLSSYFTTVSLLIKDSVNALGFQIAFYYSLAGFACAFYYRNRWEDSFQLLTRVLWPIASALFLIFIAIYSVPTFDGVTLIVSLGGIAIGIVPFLLGKRRLKREQLS